MPHCVFVDETMNLISGELLKNDLSFHFFLLSSLKRITSGELLM